MTKALEWEAFKESSGINRKLDERRESEARAIAILRRGNPPLNPHEESKRLKQYKYDRNRKGRKDRGV